MWPDEAIRERGSSVWATDQVRYTNTAGWGQDTVLIGPQGFNRGEANSGYVIAYGQIIESMGCVQDMLRGGGCERANGECRDKEWHVEGQRRAGQCRGVECRGLALGGRQHIP